MYIMRTLFFFNCSLKILGAVYMSCCEYLDARRIWSKTNTVFSEKKHWQCKKCV